MTKDIYTLAESFLQLHHIAFDRSGAEERLDYIHLEFDEDKTIAVATNGALMAIVEGQSFPAFVGKELSVHRHTFKTLLNIRKNKKNSTIELNADGTFAVDGYNIKAPSQHHAIWLNWRGAIVAQEKSGTEAVSVKKVTLDLKFIVTMEKYLKSCGSSQYVTFHIRDPLQFVHARLASVNHYSVDKIEFFLMPMHI